MLPRWYPGILDRPLAGLASEPAGNRHTRSWPVRGKHGHDAECPRLVPNGPTPAMTVRVLIVDDEPDVEALFRQQFRREVREGLYTLDFALSGRPRWISSTVTLVSRSFCWSPISICPA